MYVVQYDVVYMRQSDTACFDVTQFGMGLCDVRQLLAVR